MCWDKVINQLLSTSIHCLYVKAGSSGLRENVKLNMTTYQDGTTGVRGVGVYGS